MKEKSRLNTRERAIFVMKYLSLSEKIIVLQYKNRLPCVSTFLNHAAQVSTTPHFRGPPRRGHFEAKRVGTPFVLSKSCRNACMGTTFPLSERLWGPETFRFFFRELVLSEKILRHASPVAATVRC